jgi:undecaprenyl-diphosphatase
MSFLQSLILGIIQGLTEFLPVSSSAHLVLVPFILEWKIPQSQVFPFDVLVQIGTLLAVIAYFRKDLWSILRAFVQAIIHHKPFETLEARMGWYLILATIPAGLAGVFLKDRVEAAFNNPRITAIFLFITALFLLGSEFLSRRCRKLEQLNWLDALVAGIFQAFSIFPGISRSGASITGGMLRHLERPAAARFAFLMSIPIMLAAGIFSVPDLMEVPDLGAFLPVLIVGFVAAAVVGYLSIHWLLSFLNKRSLVYFAAYCILLASAVLILSNIRPSSADAAAEPTISPAMAQQVDTPITAIVQITSDTTTDWLLPAAAECAAGLPELAILNSSTSLDAQGDILSIVGFSWGEPESSPEYALVLTEEPLVFIVNPDNPLAGLPLAQLTGILDGTLVTWADLFSSCPDCFDKQPAADLLDLPIQWIVYPEGSDAQFAFENQFELSPRVSSAAYIVPSTAAMKEVTSSDPAAFGFLPAFTLDDSVAQVNLTDSGEVYSVTLPLLAITTVEPPAPVRQWLVCIQEKINT